MQNLLRRPLKSNEIVHHINKIRHDNRLKNLELMTVEVHNRHHHEGKHRNEIRTCIGCGTNKTYLEKPCKNSNNTTPFFRWYHSPYDKNKWHCYSCYRKGLRKRRYERRKIQGYE